MLFFKTILNAVKQESVYFVICPRQGPKMESIVLNRVGILGIFLSLQSQGFRPSATPLYPNLWSSTPSGGRRREGERRSALKRQGRLIKTYICDYTRPFL